MKDIFTRIYHSNSWRGKESRSGPGSSLTATESIRRSLPSLIRSLPIHTILDIPCGDFNWMASLLPDLSIDEYIGADVVGEMIDENKRRWPDVEFITLDITTDTLPRADLILVRDLFVHFSMSDTWKAIRNILRSQTEFILMTHFTADRTYVEMDTGKWRPINFCNLPFSLPEPFYSMPEGNVLYPDKSLSLWNRKGLLSALPSDSTAV